MFDPGNFEDRIDKLAARRLLRSALKLQARHKRNLSRANPRPHKNSAKPGQYPKARTYNLRDAVAIDPPALSTIEQRQRVRCGVLTNAIYGFYLARRGFKGLDDSHFELLSEGGY